jgi:hypothetical protein
MNRNYTIAGGIIVGLLVLIVGYFVFVRGGADSWVVLAPEEGYVAYDEFVPVDILVRMNQGSRDEDLAGTFWIVVPTDDETHLLPFIPREIGVYANEQVDPVVFGANGFKYGTDQRLTGYAYLSPLIFDGTYQARLAFGHFGGEDRETPLVYSQSDTFPLTVERIFQTRKSLEASKVTASSVKLEDGTTRLLRFSLQSTVDDIVLRALEMGKTTNHRIPDAIQSIALYDADTGGKISDLTDLKMNARTIEQFTPFVLDTPVVIASGEARNLELRAVVDVSKISNQEIDNEFFVPRIYGINSANEKIVEQVFWTLEVLK